MQELKSQRIPSLGLLDVAGMTGAVDDGELRIGHAFVERARPLVRVVLGAHDEQRRTGHIEDLARIGTSVVALGDLLVTLSDQNEVVAFPSNG